MSMSVHETSYGVLREVLCSGLSTPAGAGGDGGGIGSVEWRVRAALWALLGGHRIDGRGRCRSCRGPGGLRWRRRGVCRVLVTARFYLSQPVDVLLWHLSSEVEAGVASPGDVGRRVGVGAATRVAPQDPAGTGVLAGVGAGRSDSRTEPADPGHRAAAPPSGDSPRGGRARTTAGPRPPTLASSWWVPE